jgi:CRP-like cAMP-binding protein
MVSADDLLPLEATVVRTLERDQRLFSQGDTASAVFRVEAGAVRLERRTFDGRLVTLHTARPGQLLAEASLFSETYHCDARAVSDARVRLYPKAALLRAMRESAASAETLIRTMARQIQALRLQVELRNVRSARDRILLFLEFKADPKTRLFAFDHALQDIAAELGLTREALYRTLAGLERDGSIRRQADGIAMIRACA